MTVEKKETRSEKHNSCANSNSKNLWIAGIIVVGLVFFFCVALFNNRERVPPVRDNPQDVMSMGGQQVAYVPPGCATCPTVTNCFPNATSPTQQVAFRNPTCPVRSNGQPYYAQGTGVNPVQQAAFNPQGNGTMNQAPVIFRDALMLHEYRGVCEKCHIVQPDIAISINAQMPHNYRGVCSNCHLIQ